MITDCSHCLLYAELRGYRILAEIRKHTTDESEVGRRWKAFLKGYHEIHGEHQADMRLASRYVALMALVTEDESKVPGVVVNVNGSDARPAPPKDWPPASRSARPSDGRPARRHGGKNKPRTNDKKD